MKSIRRISKDFLAIEAKDILRDETGSFEAALSESQRTRKRFY